MTAFAEGGDIRRVGEYSLLIENDAPRGAVSEPRLELRNAGRNSACCTTATSSTRREALRLTNNRIGGSGSEGAGQSKCGESHIVKNGINANAPLPQPHPPLNTPN